MATPADEEFADFTRRSIAAGYLRRDQVVDALLERAGGELEPSAAADLVLALWEERLHTQSHWSASTDCDRLDAAFEQLAGGGLLTRQHFGCCLRHGFEALVNEHAATAADGFVFFSEPDTAHAVDGRGLELAYGAFAVSDAGAEERTSRILAVGRRVVDALRHNGLDVQWPEDVEHRILVDLDWERRLPTGSPEPVR